MDGVKPEDVKFVCAKCAALVELCHRAADLIEDSEERADLDDVKRELRMVGEEEE
jgi:hypothetical protein